MSTIETVKPQDPAHPNRREVLLSGAAFGIAAAMTGHRASAQTAVRTQLSDTTPSTPPRMLGSLEVSAVGLGCQWLPGRPRAPCPTSTATPSTAMSRST